MPKVSVIIPVYKTEQYLRQCLDSVLSQTLADIEIICVNDGSPDNSIDILREYEHLDSRIVIIDKKNEGVGKARNDGIKQAIGNYIAFMDSDDYYPNSEVLCELYNAAREYQVKIVGGYALAVNGLEQFPLKPDTFGKIEFSLQEGVNDYTTYAYDYEYWKYIYERHMLVDNQIYFPTYSRFQDPPFFVHAMVTAEKFAYINHPSYAYRIAEKGIHISAKKAEDMIQAMIDNLVFAKANNIPKLYYLTALRLNYDVSNVFEYLIIHGEDMRRLLPSMIRANGMIDFDYINKHGYDGDSLILFESFRFMLHSTEQYAKLRNNSVIRTIVKLKSILKKDNKNV